ncbi:hypothetical protein BYT27DRAFT_7225178 [Phlegmacium glaucopus]|nr:hypothetical protein BYT27DRAFT_7225178 [Phlegmacium glaucopus]
MDPLLEPNRKRGAKYQLKFYKEPQVIKRPRMEKYYSYVKYTSTLLGGVSATQSSIQTTIIAESEDNVMPGYSEPDESNDWIDAGDNEPPLDQAYLDHISKAVINECLKRERPKGVSPKTLQQWELYCDQFLKELMVLEGRGAWVLEMCVRCSSRPAKYECVDCSGCQMKCHLYMVECHVCLPFHRIQKWNRTFFEDSPLKELGLQIQLGHPIGEKSGDNFTVISAHGIQSIRLDFCGCGKSSQDHIIQLLQARLFPATIKYPKTAATFDCLETCKKLSYVSKISAFEFYHMASRLTDDTRTKTPKWQHLKMMKHSGRGHDPAGVSQTKEGECAVLCPTCPQPGKNMLLGWEDEPENRQYLYALFLALDTNFWLKHKNISSNEADPSLSKGWAYIVEETKYKAHFELHKAEVELKSTCSRHDVVNLTDSKPNCGYAASGGGMVDCSCHDMKRPNSFGDLQKGERYCNMDYLFYHSIQKSQLKNFIISYDIACQWSINLKERMFTFDHKFFLFNGVTQVKFFIAKFHLPAHISACWSNYLFNYGKGTRQDTLDYHFGYHNWQKVTGMGASLCRKLLSAATDMAEHTISHNELSSMFPKEILNSWTKQVKAWENDPTQLNPFKAIIQGIQLAEEEVKDLAAGKDFTLNNKVSPSVLIATGLDLEAEQRSLATAVKQVWEHAQDHQQTKVQLHSNELQHKIDSWCKFQLLYCPAITTLHAPSPNNNSASLVNIEWKLQHAQAYESLDSLQHYLQIDAATAEYRVAYGALLLLSSQVFEFGWKNELLPLKGEDICDLSEGKVEQLGKKQSEGRRIISWIWKTVPADDLENDDFLRERVCIEWCKLRAHASRFTEEVALLVEEMHHVLHFFN